MKDLLELLAKKLVSNPESVSVNEIEGEQSIILELKVHEEDMGKIIGKEGRIIKALRTVIRAMANRNGQNVTIEIIQA